MLTKRITFEGVEGPITEEYLFHITQAQILELNLPYANDPEVADSNAPTGLAKYFQEIVDTNDSTKIYEQFKRIVLLAVGKKSEDGKRFLKSDEIRQDFENTEAYSELIIELMEDAEKAAQFFAGIMPAKVQEQARQATIDEANAAASPPAVVPAAAPSTPTTEGRVVSQADLASIDPVELHEGLADGSIIIR